MASVLGSQATMFFFGSYTNPETQSTTSINEQMSVPQQTMLERQKRLNFLRESRQCVLLNDFILTQQLMVVPRYRFSTVGRQAFAVHGPMVWNSLPDDLRAQQD